MTCEKVLFYYLYEMWIIGTNGSYGVRLHSLTTLFVSSNELTAYLNGYAIINTIKT